MTISVRERAVTWASESTYGTNAIGGSPTYYKTLGDAPRVAPIRTVVESNGVKAIHSGNAHRTFPSHAEVNLECELMGKLGAPGTAALQGALLQAAGFSQTLIASTSAVYRPVTYHTDAVAPALSVREDHFDANGQYRRYLTTGVRGNMAINLTIDNFATIALQGIGRWEGDAAAPASGTAPDTYDAGKAPLLVRGLTTSLDGEVRCLKSLEFATNWSVEEDRQACGSTSLKSVHLRRGDASRIGGSLLFSDADTFASVLAAWTADSVIDLSAVLSDGTDTITITGKIQFGQYDRGGANLTEYSVPFFFLPTSGEDDVTFTFS